MSQEPKKQPKPRKRNYLNNKDLLAEVILSKQNDQMTDKLAKMLTLLCDRYSRKGNFVNYSYLEDMRSYAMLMLVKTWSSFNPEKSDNPFAYFSQCIKNSFIQYLNQEKKQRNIRDELLVDQGLNPSHTYQMEMAKKEKEARIAEGKEEANTDAVDVDYDNHVVHGEDHLSTDYDYDGHSSYY